MKRFYVFAVLFLSSSLSAFAASFPDVAPDHKNYEAIEYLDNHQIINGYKDGSFGPSNLVNRAEAMKMITLSLNMNSDGSYDILFPDVKKEDWFFKYVMAAHKEGIINGYKDGKFKPASTINLAETLKILLSSAKVQLPTVTEVFYQDVKVDDWFAPYMMYARDHNIIFSDDYGFVHPDQSMSRADFAELIYRLITVLQNKGETFPLDKNWTEYSSKMLPFEIKYDKDSWQIVENKNEIIFFKPDKEYSQVSPLKIYPNTAKLTVTLDNNSLNMAKNQYFENIKAAFKDGQFNDLDLNGLKALEVLFPPVHAKDWYIYLPNGKVLIVYTQYGDGVLRFQSRQTIAAMLKNLQYKEIPEVQEPDYSELLSEIFKNILIEGKGLEMLNSLPDKKIIETDTIGVGTGPVDYYFSNGINYTFKYERSKDVILDKREGSTTKF